MEAMSRESANRFSRLGNPAGTERRARRPRAQKAWPDRDDVWYRLGVKRPLALAAVCLSLAMMAAPVAAQTPLFQQPGLPGLVDLQGLDQPRRAPLTITPSLTLTGEYNDNVFADNRNRVSDFIIGFTPGIAVTYERPTYRLSTGYNFTAEIFAKERDQDHAFDRQNFWLDTLWRVDPHVTLTLTDAFAFSTDTNLISRESISTGRERSLGNTLGGGVAWQIDPLWRLRTNAYWTAQRFETTDLLNSDVYRATVFLDRQLTREITGTAGYEFTYFDIRGQPNFTAHAPRIGGAWQPTATASFSLNGGPAFLIREDGDTTITPVLTATYAQRLPFGLAGVSYDRYLGTASGLGGPTENDYISGYLVVTSLLRGLTVQLVPRYTIAKSPHGSAVDIKALTGSLYAVYRLTEVVSLIGGYQFFHQRSDSTAVSTLGNPIATDADQNRVFFGIQFGYPIRFD